MYTTVVLAPKTPFHQYHIFRYCCDHPLRRTLKYLEFLSGGNFNSRPKSCSTLSLSKLNIESSMRDIEIARSDSEPDYGSQVMLDLIRQEEGRADRCVKKIGRKMRNFTNSSRNIFNEKYTTLMRKIDENSSSSGSRSLSGVIYFPGKNLKPHSETNSMLDIHKTYRWTSSNSSEVERDKHTVVKGLQRTIHPIVRSVSDDSAMKQPSDVKHHRGAKHNNTLYAESETAKSCTSGFNQCTKEDCTCESGQCPSKMGTLDNLSKDDEAFVDVTTAECAKNETSNDKVVGRYITEILR